MSGYKRKILMLLLPIALLAGVAKAEKCPIITDLRLELGREFAYSQFLAPATYSGFDLGLSATWSKRMPWAPKRAFMAFDVQVDVQPEMLNPAKTASMFGVGVEASWMMGAFWKLPKQFALSIGGGPEIEGGCLALLKNSNNPAAPNIAASLGADAAARWQGRIGKLTVSAMARLRAQLLGAFFMNGYGETFYEIYLGNREGLVHFGWPGNRQKFDLRAEFNLHFGKRALSLGYHLNSNRASANNHTYHLTSHAFTIGLTLGGKR